MSPPSLVLLHGFAGTKESWSGVCRHLRGPSLALSLLGHHAAGETSAAVDGFEPEVDRLAACIAREASPPVHLVGYSLGARLALGVAVRHRSLLERVTLIGVHPGLESSAERRQREARDEAWAQRLEREGLESFVAAWEAQPLFATQGRLADTVRREQRRLRRGLDASGLARAMRRLGLARMPSFRRQLSGLDLPVQLVVGELDTKFRRLAEVVAAALPRCRVDVVAEAGHNLPLEAPDRLAALLVSFAACGDEGAA